MIDLYETTPYLENVVKQTGYKTLKSLMFLHHLVKRVQPDVILELGTGFGCSAIFMALASNGVIHTIDDYRGDTCLDVNIPLNNFSACGVVDWVGVINGDTRLLQTFKGSPEIVFMDASHNRMDLWSEYAAFELLLMKKHIIVIDDLFSTDVKEFALDLLKKDCYDICFMPKFHDGMAILTSYKFLDPVVMAIEEGSHYA